MSKPVVYAALAVGAAVWIVIALSTGKTPFFGRGVSTPGIVSREKEPGAFWTFICALAVAAAIFGLQAYWES